MWKWIFISLTVVTALALWMLFDPEARALASQARAYVNAALAQTGLSGSGNSLFAPIAREMDKFANSVSTLLSSVTIRIEMPSLQLPR